MAMEVDSDIVALIGAKEIQLLKAQKRTSEVIEAYNNMLGAWAFIDCFLLPFMALQMKSYNRRHSLRDISKDASIGESPGLPASLLSGGAEAEIIYHGSGAAVHTA